MLLLDIKGILHTKTNYNLDLIFDGVWIQKDPLSQMTRTKPLYNPKYEIWRKVSLSVEDPFKDFIL